MAKVTITIEDKIDGKVSVVMDPSVEMMLKMDESGNSLTSAQGYALYAANQLRKAAKDEGELIVKMPSFGR